MCGGAEPVRGRGRGDGLALAQLPLSAVFGVVADLRSRGRTCRAVAVVGVVLGRWGGGDPGVVGADSGQLGFHVALDLRLLGNDEVSLGERHGGLAVLSDHHVLIEVAPRGLERAPERVHDGVAAAAVALRRRQVDQVHETRHGHHLPLQFLGVVAEVCANHGAPACTHFLVLADVLQFVRRVRLTGLLSRHALHLRHVRALFTARLDFEGTIAGNAMDVLLDISAE